MMRYVVGLLLCVSIGLLGSACTAAPPPVEEGGIPVGETKRVYYPSEGPGEKKQLKRQYRVLVHWDGLVEQHGEETEWYESGTLKAEREFRHALPTGVWKMWFADGVQRSYISFGDGQQREPIRWWHPNGTLAGEGAGIAGVKDGPWTYWFLGGQKSGEGSYLNGVRAGSWTFWFESGDKRAEGTYDGGARVAQWKLWDEEGNLVLKLALPASADLHYQ